MVPPQREQHDYVCPACIHRQHDGCDKQCRYCDAGCQCVCRRWQIPVETA